MKISKEHIQILLNSVAKTEDDEVSCQTCEDQIAQFAEVQLKGKEIPAALKAIEDHLTNCPECAEEMEFLRRALESELKAN